MAISKSIRNASYDSLVEDLKKKDLEERADNYADFSYLLSQISVNIHLDKIDEYVENIFPDSEDKLFRIFGCLDYKRIFCNLWPKKEKQYSKKRKYAIDGSEVEILYDLKDFYKRYTNFPPVKITIQDPNIDSIKSINLILDLLKLKSHTSRIEFALDFHTLHESWLEALKEFFVYHLFLKFHRHGSFVCSKNIINHEDYTDYGNYTFYVKDTRKQVKAIKIYIKEDINKRKFLRLELVANRPFIKKYELSLSSLENRDTSIITDLLSFKQFNREKYYKHQVNLHKRRLERKIKSGKDISLSLRHLQCMSDRDKLSEDLQQGSLMNRVKWIKLLENLRLKRLGKKNVYGNVMQYFEDLEDCNEAFSNLIAGKFFL